MKNINKILLLLILVMVTGSIYSQTFEEQKQELINSLSDTARDSGCNGIDLILEFKIEEAVHVILENIWKQGAYCRTQYLWVLYYFKAEETESIALAMLDSLNGYVDKRMKRWKNRFTPEVYGMLTQNAHTELELKSRVVETLFEIGNYENYQIVFDRIDEVAPKLDYGAIFMLPEIIFHYSEHEERAKNELIKFAYESNDETFKSYAVTCLDTVYGETMIDVYLDVFTTSTDYGVRVGVLNHILSKYPSPKVNEILKQRLSEDSFGHNRYKIAKYLLEQYGTISDYLFVNNYLSSETNEEYKSYIEKENDSFRVPYPDLTTTVESMLDTLRNYTTQSYSFDWLKDEAYKNELSNKIGLAKNYLLSNDSLSCRTEIELFRNSVAQIYQDSTGSYPNYISDAGYKFMYYQADYILERLPETDPLPVELTMFVGEVVDTTVVLHWQTATEINNYGFSVEQNSILFPDWKEIGFVEGHGNSYSPKEYTFVDTLSSIDTVADTSTQLSYRLKQIDTNGGYKYSKIITVIIEY